METIRQTGKEMGDRMSKTVEAYATFYHWQLRKLFPADWQGPLRLFINDNPKEFEIDENTILKIPVEIVPNGEE